MYIIYPAAHEHWSNVAEQPHNPVHKIWLDDNDRCQVINTSRFAHTQELCPASLLGKLSCDQQRDIRMLQHSKKGAKNILNYIY